MLILSKINAWSLIKYEAKYYSSVTCCPGKRLNVLASHFGSAPCSVQKTVITNRHTRRVNRRTRSLDSFDKFTEVFIKGFGLLEVG